MKAGWERKKLADLCERITKGSSPKWQGISYVNEPGVLFVTSENVGECSLLMDKPKYVEEKFNAKEKKSILKNGDVLTNIVGASIGRTAIFDLDEVANINQAVCLLRCKPSLLNNYYLAYLLNSPFLLQVFDDNKVDTARANLSLGFFSLLEIPLPPLPEQQRIVGILDEAFDGIATAKANAERNLQNARALFESHLQSVFTQRGEGWVETTLGEQIRFIDYRGKTPEKTASGLRLITAKNVKMGYLQREPMEFVAPDSYDGWMTRGIPKLGDVLFTTEAPLANVAQLDTEDKVVFAQRIIIMQTDAAKLDSTYLKYLLLSQPVQQRIHAKGTGATVQGIKASLLKTIEISFPNTISEQQQIVTKLDALRDETQRLESIYQQKLAALDELKKSLLHQAFTGQL